MKSTETPKCYLSHSSYGWSLILQEMPLCNYKETAAEALAVAKTFKVEPHPTHYWNGTLGDFEPRADSLEKRAAELLQITENLLTLHIAHHNEPAHAHARKVIQTMKGTQ